MENNPASHSIKISQNVAINKSFNQKYILVGHRYKKKEKGMHFIEESAAELKKKEKKTSVNPAVYIYDSKCKILRQEKFSESN